MIQMYQRDNKNMPHSIFHIFPYLSGIILLFRKKSAFQDNLLREIYWNGAYLDTGIIGEYQRASYINDMK